MSRPGSASRFPRSAVRGFTLVELLLVLAIVSILVAIAVPRFQSVGRRWIVEEASRELAAHLKRARAEAVRQGSRVDVVLTDPSRGGFEVVQFDPSPREIPDFSVPERHGLLLPATAGRLVRARHLPGHPALDSPRGRIRFFPDGTCAGGPVRIVDVGAAAGMEVRVDPVLGLVSLRPLPAGSGRIPAWRGLFSRGSTR